tara:strand:+ start:8209 stop:8745 length:537 start_codon:yes stop_codon:yes gene_type:complete
MSGFFDNSKFVEISNNIIVKYNITLFTVCNADKRDMNVYSPDIYNVTLYYNNNYIFVIIGENCFIVPKLCALKWKYFEAIINRYSNENPVVIDITNLLIDSGALVKLSYTHFARDFCRFLSETRAKNLFLRPNDYEGWVIFLKLLIPPEGYWADSTHESVFHWPDTTTSVLEELDGVE